MNPDPRFLRMVLFADCAVPPLLGTLSPFRGIQLIAFHFGGAS
jgi:hypothetical protein